MTPNAATPAGNSKAVVIAFFCCSRVVSSHVCVGGPCAIFKKTQLLSYLHFCPVIVTSPPKWRNSPRNWIATAALFRQWSVFEGDETSGSGSPSLPKEPFREPFLSPPVKIISEGHGQHGDFPPFFFFEPRSFFPLHLLIHNSFWFQCWRPFSRPSASKKSFWVSQTLLARQDGCVLTTHRNVEQLSFGCYQP